MAFTGTLGFSLLFQVRKKYLIITSFGGMVTWGVYLILKQFIGGIFLPYMLAAVFAALYSEVMARILKVPVTTFLMLALIPAIPGGALYYTMSNLVQSNMEKAQSYGYLTIQYVLAIAIGTSIVWAAKAILFRMKEM